LLRLHVISRTWLAELRLDAWKPIPHTSRLIAEMKAELKPDGSRRLTDKSIANCLGVLHRMFKTAILADLCVRQPIVYEPGTLDTTTDKEIEIYEKPEVVALTRDTRIPWPIRVLNGLCTLGGLREGEAVGAKFGELDLAPECLPLGALVVRRQYEGRKLKTKRPRVVPLHPELRALLDAWLSHGFELYTGRKPTPEDFIVPNVSKRAKKPHHTRSTYYKHFIKACLAAGIRPRSLHATRHTFISLCRRGGARADVFEKVTHNAKGTMVDRYTHFDWDPLCEAVLCLNLDVRRTVQPTLESAGNSGPGAAGEMGSTARNSSGLALARSVQFPAPPPTIQHENRDAKKSRQDFRQEIERRVFRAKARLGLVSRVNEAEFRAKARAWFRRAA